MSAGNYNFTIEQGIGFTTVFRWSQNDDEDTPVDISGLDPVMQIRASKSKTSKLYADLTEYLTTMPEDGTVTLSIPGDVTDQFDFDTGHYSLRLGRSARLIEGLVTLSQETSA
ncbi:hypothetical protein [Mycolicibacterium neoaurum]|uniref:hypothetical protein n=1 Tax=Mycolicibacterium neoaurum TaxID=1795 RepID=UPI001F4C9161|nr:hypothetical protein [Mycolicibacterium neoaurum]